MSDYQYYEFLAVDSPLSAGDMKALRDISRRAKVTKTSFANEYISSDISTDPLDILARYFDIFLYHSSWGTRRLAFRIPRTTLDERVLESYLVPYRIMLSTRGEFSIIDILNDDMVDWSWEVDDTPWMTGLAPARDDLVRGDLRPLYIAWLMAAQSGAVASDDIEPPPPPGLGALAPAQAQLARFLRVGEGLLAVAADASVETSQWHAALAAWIAELPADSKDRLLFEVATEDPMRVGALMIKAFHVQFHVSAEPDAHAAPRLVRDLLNQAMARDKDMERERERRAEDERQRRDAEAARKRAEYLATLVEREPAIWDEVERLVSLRKPAAYDQARVLLCDLRDLATQQDTREQFAEKLAELQKRHQRKSSFLVHLRRAGLAR